MAAQPAFAVLILIVAAPMVDAAKPPALRSRFTKWVEPRQSNRTLGLAEVTWRLERALEKGVADQVEVKLAPMFAALPKNEHGMINPTAFKYAVHRHFSSKFAWHINGVGSHVDDAVQHEITEEVVHHAEHADMKIELVQAPAILMEELEAKESMHGLSLRDLGAMVSTLQQMVGEDAGRILGLAYKACGLDTADTITLAELPSVVESVFTLARDGFDGKGGDVLDIQVHTAFKQKRRKSHPCKALVEYMVDQGNNWIFARRNSLSPFSEITLTYDVVAKIYVSALLHYGPIQNGDCTQMKDYMIQLDPMGSGRVPLQIFYDQPDKHIFRFSEPLEYLNKIGALDTSNPQQPGVVISNYILGPANCYRSSSLFTFCCMSECEELLAEIEEKAQGPFAAPQMLLELTSNFSTTSVEAPRQLPEGLPEKLQMVAAKHSGMVPLHGRLFSQWLHFAFPSECPYPQVAMAAAPEISKEWMEVGSVGSQPIEPSLGSWTDDELLPLFEPEKKGNRGVLRSLFTYLVSLLAVAAMGKMLWDSAHKAMRVMKRQGGRSDMKLPMHHQ